MKCRAGSLLECSIPWLTKQYGYNSSIRGTFHQVQAHTNMPFKEFLTAEKLVLDIQINYPLVWNDMQTWNVDIELTRASVFFVFYHKIFFQNMINDWSSRNMADIRFFVPYVYKFNLRVTDLEVILPCNQYNWIDVHRLDNNGWSHNCFHIFCETFDLTL